MYDAHADDLQNICQVNPDNLFMPNLNAHGVDNRLINTVVVLP